MLYQFKLYELNKEWDDIPVTHEDYYDTDSIAALFAISLAKKHKCEVRMNKKDSHQGHYFRPYREPN